MFYQSDCEVVPFLQFIFLKESKISLYVCVCVHPCVYIFIRICVCTVYAHVHTHIYLRGESASHNFQFLSFPTAEVVEIKM